MSLHTEKLRPSFDFRRQSTLGLTLSSLIILAPITISNFIQGYYALGIASIIILAILAYNSWMVHRNQYPAVFVNAGLISLIFFFLSFTLQRQGIGGILWCYPVVLLFYIMLPERKAWLTNALLIILIIPQVWQLFTASLAIKISASLLAISLFSAILIRVTTRTQQELELRAATDPLTGLFNRTLLLDTLEHAIERHDPIHLPMTLVVLDLDYFKVINDTLGHHAGDRVLCNVGNFLRYHFRRIDKVFRLGGEEFLVLLYGTDIESGKDIAEKLRRSFVSSCFLLERPVTVSIGIAALLPGEDWNTWMKRADDNLYRAKLAGRNRVVA